MIIYPAIDLRAGKVVRLKEGVQSKPDAQCRELTFVPVQQIEDQVKQQAAAQQQLTAMQQGSEVVSNLAGAAGSTSWSPSGVSSRAGSGSAATQEMPKPGTVDQRRIVVRRRPAAAPDAGAVDPRIGAAAAAVGLPTLTRAADRLTSASAWSRVR